MIKDLQKKFILVAMLAIIIVTGSLFGLIIAENYSNTTRQMDALLELGSGECPKMKFVL